MTFARPGRCSRQRVMRHTSTPRRRVSRAERSSPRITAYVDDWAEHGLDFVRGEAAGERARAAVAKLIGADAADVALIASVSSAAGFVAAQFGTAERGQNVVIGEREYSSNHYPWRQLAAKGYEVRQVPFRNGGLEPDEVARYVDGATVLVAFSGVQPATGHRSDIQAISSVARAVGAIVFVRRVAARRARCPSLRISP